MHALADWAAEQCGVVGEAPGGIAGHVHQSVDALAVADGAETISMKTLHVIDSNDGF